MNGVHVATSKTMKTKSVSKPKLIITSSLGMRDTPTKPLLRFVRDYANVLKKYELHTTDGTGRVILSTGMYEKDKDIYCKRPGSKGGIAQLAALVVRGDCEAAILLLDPADPWSDSEETWALRRVCIDKKVRLITTYATAVRWATYEVSDAASYWKDSEYCTQYPFDEVFAANSKRPLERLEDGYPNIIEIDGRRELKYLEIGERTIALVSHDAKKLEMIQFVEPHLNFLALHNRILTTGTTGWLLKLLFTSKEENPEEYNQFLIEVWNKGLEGRLMTTGVQLLKEYLLKRAKDKATEKKNARIELDRLRTNAVNPPDTAYVGNASQGNVVNVPIEILNKLLPYRDKEMGDELIEVSINLVTDLLIGDSDLSIQQPSHSLDTLVDTLKRALKLSSSIDFAKRVKPEESGPRGGDVIVANQILENRCHTLIFFHDPLTKHAHEDDIRLLERTTQLPDIYADCVSDEESARSWIDGLRMEIMHKDSRSPKRMKKDFRGLELAQELRRNLHLKEVLLVDTPNSAEPTELGSELARIGAGYFHLWFKAKIEATGSARIAVGHGKTMLYLYGNLEKLITDELLPLPPSSEEAVWLPLSGQLKMLATNEEATRVAQSLYELYSGQSRSDKRSQTQTPRFSVSGFVEPEVKIYAPDIEVMNMLCNADMILATAAPWKEGVTLLQNKGYEPEGLPPFDGPCVGLISGVFFDRDGSEVCPSGYVHIGLSHGGFQAVAKKGEALLMCAGESRQLVLRAILKGELASVIVTNRDSATWLLNNYKDPVTPTNQANEALAFAGRT